MELACVSVAVSARPALSFAYAAALLVAGAMVMSQVQQTKNTAWNKQPEVAGSAAVYNKQLTSSEDQTMLAWADPDPEIAAVIKSDLTLADQHISLCQQTVREQPQNELARDYLNDAYQQKAELLATMVERGANLQ